ncbi:MAG: DUF2062 domain-containing protein [Hyphomicrobiales bacterium]|nr:MAG: DUF2062 domain-containing protein [Hyphomicrobiales bacterium]
MLFKSREKPSLARRVRLWLWPRTAWNRSVKYVWRRLGRLSASPHAVALGCAAGVFASFTPFMGFHFIIAAILAWMIGGNLLASALGTFFGNPITFPFIWLSTYNLGGVILMDMGPGRSVNFSEQLHSKSFDAILPLIKPMLVGGVPLGVTFGLIMYFPVRAAVTSYQARRKQRLGQEVPAE